MEIIKMNILNSFLTICLGLFIWKYLPKYFEEKAKNLATKEDFSQVLDQLKKTTEITEKIKRETNISNLIFKQRIDALNEIWLKFNDVRLIYVQRMVNGHENWIRSHKEKAITALNEYKDSVERNQVVLDTRIIDSFKKIDMFLFEELARNDRLMSDYDKELKQLLSETSEQINELMTNSTQKINLDLGR